VDNSSAALVASAFKAVVLGISGTSGDNLWRFDPPDIFLGPFTLSCDVAPQNRNFGTVLLLLLIVGVLFGVIRPRCAWLSIVAARLWVAIGVVGAGIEI
jgi:hypothetical protein